MLEIKFRTLNIETNALWQRDILAFFWASFLWGYLTNDCLLQRWHHCKQKKIFPKRILVNKSFIGVTYSNVHTPWAVLLLKKSLPTKRGVRLLKTVPKAMVQTLVTSTHLVLWFSTCGFCPLWGQMTLSQGSPKTFGKYKPLCCDL